MKIKLHYPMTPHKDITFEPGQNNYIYFSVGGELWYKVELLCTDTVQFNRLDLKLLKYELNKCLHHKHTLSKCKVLEDFLCKLNKEH